MKLISYTYILIFFHLQMFGQSAHALRLEAEKKYNQKKFDEAAQLYKEAAKMDGKASSSYNSGNAEMNLKKYEDATLSYGKATDSQDNEQRSKAYYNQGNALFLQKKYNESIRAYKNSLKYNPLDIKTKENLAIARKQLKKQQQNQNQNNQQQKDNKENQKNQDQNPNENNPNPSNQDKSKNTNTPQDPKMQPPKESNGPKNNMTKEEIDRLLNMMDSQDKKVQGKLKRVENNKAKSNKDW